MTDGTVQLPPVPKDEVSPQMRAEAATRAREHTNWVMASLITVNGGAILALLNEDARTLPVGIALAAYAVGIVAALIGGQLAARLAHETEALMIADSHRDWITRYRNSLIGRVDDAHLAGVSESVEAAERGWQQQWESFDKAISPTPALGVGILAFLAGCIAAGFALFGS